MKTINNEKQYKIAEERIEDLLSVVDNMTPKDDVNFIELSLLSDIVADYEESQFPVAKPSLIDTIKLRMFEMNLSQKKLAELLEVSSSRVSEYLRGKREISLKTAKKLHQKLDIDAEIILQA